MVVDEPQKKGMTYADAGVDVEVEEKGIKQLVSALGYQRSTGIGTPIHMPGGYAGMVRFGDHALVLCTDGVGSKVEIARAVGRYDTVGIDCMAMNVNDALCVGAEPIAFVDYLAVETHDDRFMREVGAGLGAAAQKANVTIVGGETATLPGIVKGFDLAGTCLAVVEEKKILDGSKVQAGDAIIGLPSFGIHSNGYSLVRKIVEKEGLDYSDRFPGYGMQESTVGDVLLEPTRIYVRAILHLLNGGVDVHGLAHITGGGLMNIPRIRKGFRYEIEKPLAPQAVFDWIQRSGDVEIREMYKTFNMGMGFTVVLPEDQVDEALRLLREMMDDEKPLLCPDNAGEPARRIGQVTDGEGCHLVPHDLTYGSKT